MTKAQAFAEFRENILPHLPVGDIPAKCEAWNNYTDMLCKDRQITEKQYSTWCNPF